jgi:hypothetical protein
MIHELEENPCVESRRRRTYIGTLMRNPVHDTELRVCGNTCTVTVISLVEIYRSGKSECGEYENHGD